MDGPCNLSSLRWKGGGRGSRNIFVSKAQPQSGDIGPCSLRPLRWKGLGKSLNIFVSKAQPQSGDIGPCSLSPLRWKGEGLGCEQTERQRQRQGERQIGSHWVHCVQVPLTLTLQNGSGTD